MALLDCLSFKDYFLVVKATITSKGQITIPIQVRNKFHLKPGDILVFDESAPFLKATKIIPPEAWDQFAAEWEDPWPDRTLPEVLDGLRGPTELPPEPKQP